MAGKVKRRTAGLLTSRLALCTLAHTVPISPQRRRPMATDARQRAPRRILVLSCLLSLTLVSLAAAQTGTVTGKVTDESGGAALEAARVVLSGTTRIETTDREGGYTFRAVAPGTYSIRVLRVGYRPAAQSLTVGDGET